MTYLVALGRTALATTGSTTAGAVTADVTRLAASVASLVVLRTLRAVAGHVTLVAAVVAVNELVQNQLQESFAAHMAAWAEILLTTWRRHAGGSHGPGG